MLELRHNLRQSRAKDIEGYALSQLKTSIGLCCSCTIIWMFQCVSQCQMDFRPSLSTEPRVLQKKLDDEREEEASAKKGGADGGATVAPSSADP